MLKEKKKHHKLNSAGFTLAELLIVVAIIAVLVTIGITVFTDQVERSRESADLSNVRSAYGEVMAAALAGDPAAVDYSNGVWYKTVELTQQKDDWQRTMPVTIGSVTSTDTARWIGCPGSNGQATVYYSFSDYTISDGSAIAQGACIEWTGGTPSGTTPVTIAGLGESYARPGGGWSANSSGLMSISAGTADASSKVALISTPMALSKGATVSITNADGYQTGYFLMKYVEGQGYVKVTDSGWKKGTTTFTVDEDGLFLATNTKKSDGTNISVSEAESNVSVSVTGNAAYDTTGMSATSILDSTGVTSAAKTGVSNSESSKTGGTVTTTANSTRSYAETSVTKGSVVQVGGNEAYSYAYFFVREDDNTVLYDSGWMPKGTTTSLVVPENCRLYVQVQGSSMTETKMQEAMASVQIYSK